MPSDVQSGSQNRFLSLDWRQSCPNQGTGYARPFPGCCGGQILATTNKAFWCHHRDGYLVISFPRELATAHMAEVREAGMKILEHLEKTQSPSCVVDLTALDYMGSSLVASIVRIWKSVKGKDGRMVVVTSNERTYEVLKATGLTKVWTITPTFESGVHALGFSPEAKVEKRELRLLEFVGPIAVIGGAAVVAAKLLPELKVGDSIPTWVVYTILGLALLASGVAMLREKGVQRVLSTLGFLVSAPLLGFFIWHMEFRFPVPVNPHPTPVTVRNSAESAEDAPNESDAASVEGSGMANTEEDSSRGEVSGIPVTPVSDTPPVSDNPPVTANQSGRGETSVPPAVESLQDAEKPTPQNEAVPADPKSADPKPDDADETGSGTAPQKPTIAEADGTKEPEPAKEPEPREETDAEPGSPEEKPDTEKPESEEPSPELPESPEQPE